MYVHAHMHAHVCVRFRREKYYPKFQNCTLVLSSKVKILLVIFQCSYYIKCDAEVQNACHISHITFLCMCGVPECIYVCLRRPENAVRSPRTRVPGSL